MFCAISHGMQYFSEFVLKLQKLVQQFFYLSSYKYKKTRFQNLQLFPQSEDIICVFYNGIEIAPLIFKVLRDLPKYSTISEYDISIAKVNSTEINYRQNLTYCTCQRKRFACHTHSFPFPIRFSSFVLSMTGMYLPSFEG